MGAAESVVGGRQAYFAVAKVKGVRPDLRLADHFYADVTDYLEFDRAVPFREGAHYFESALQRDDGGTSKGAFGRAVRNVPDAEFDLILAAGFAPLVDADALARRPDISLPSGFEDEPASFERPIVERLTRRPFRDAAFALAVKRAYGDTCALTGLKIVNGGGRTEAQAAHIRPVEHSGPDSVRNGMALSATAHWIFDRGLVSVDEDLTILTAKVAAPEALGRLLLPERPHPCPPAAAGMATASTVPALASGACVQGVRADGCLGRRVELGVTSEAAVLLSAGGRPCSLGGP